MPNWDYVHMQFILKSSCWAAAVIKRFVLCDFTLTSKHKRVIVSLSSDEEEEPAKQVMWDLYWWNGECSPLSALSLKQVCKGKGSKRKYHFCPLLHQASKETDSSSWTNAPGSKPLRTVETFQSIPMCTWQVGTKAQTPSYQHKRV